MKKLLSVLCCLFLTTIMASCANTSDLDNSMEKEQLPESTKDYVIYCDPSAGKLIRDEQETTDVAFKNADTKVFSFSSKTKINKPHDAEDKRSFELNGKTYSLEYSATYETALSSSNSFKSYSLFNSYRSDTVHADTRVGTNELMLFAILDVNELTAAGDVTEDEAKAIAESTILSLYGDKSRNEYAYDNTIYTDSKLEVIYTVVYRKYVWGTPTNDSIQISVNMKGNVVGVNAKYMGMFSSAEEQVSKDSISDAISVLNKTFSGNWRIGTTRLVLDAEGNYYISALLSRKVSGELEAVMVYINVI